MANQIKSGVLPITYLFREQLIKDTNYNEAVTYFKTAELISPCYIIISGTLKNEGNYIF